MQRCKQMSDIAKNGVMFQSESSAGKEYQVLAFRLNEMDFCNCVAFVMARNKEAKRLGLKEKGISAAGLASDCKHLREVRRVTCQWTQKSEDEYRYDETCPKCGGPVVEEGKPMIPGGVGHDADHVDDLRAMLAELKGGSDAEIEATAAEITADAIDAEQQAEQDEMDAVVEAAEDVIGTVEAPPVNRQHGTIPDDPGEWLEDLIASRNGVIPEGDDWKQLRELWGPIYGKRKLDAAYKAASTPDAILRRHIVVDREAQDAEVVEEFGYNPFRSVGADAPEDVIAELEDEYHGGPVPAGDDTETPTAVQIDEEPEDELLDGNGDADPAFFGQMVSVDVVMECVEEVLGEYLGGSFAGQAYSQIEERIHARIDQPIAPVVPISAAPPKPGPEAAAERLAKLVKP